MRDPVRIRRLFIRYHGATLLIAALCVLLGLAGLAGGGAAYAMVEGSERWSAAGVVGGLGLIAALAGLAFALEAWRSPLRAYAGRPHAYVIEKGAITHAVYLRRDRRGFYRVRGSFGTGGAFMADFAPELWSPNGRPRQLPIDAWVLHAIEESRAGTLVGLPRL